MVARLSTESTIHMAAGSFARLCSRRSRLASDPWSKLVYDDLALDEKQHYESLVEVYETMLHGRREAS